MEKKYVPEGVFLTCDKGTIPCQLSVTFNANTVIYGQNLATEADKLTGVNVKPMGLCAATHGPCVPAPLTWSPVQNDVLVGNNRLLLEDSKLQCSLSGRISIFFSMAAAQAACATVPPEKSLLDQADDYLAKLGPAGDVARFQMGVAEGLYGGGKSMVEGLWDLAKGGWHAATHPVETAQVVGGAASSAWNWASHGDNWSNAASAAGQGIGNAADWASHGDNWGKAWDGAADWASHQSPRDWGKIGGRATFEVAMAVGTGGAGEALNVAGKAGEVANLASKAGEVANVAEKGAEALNLTEKGLEAANVIEKVGEAGNAAGKAEVVGIVTNGAEDAASAARVGEEVSQTSKGAEAAEGCAERGKCTEVGHPVDISNGMVFTQHTDFELPGPIPLSWMRTWYSRSQRRGPLGHGWHHRYDIGLVLEEDGRVAVRLADGRLAVFAPTEPGSKSYNRREKLELEHQAAGGYRVWNVRERVWYVFALHAGRPEQVLAAIEDANGFAIGLRYTASGHLSTLTDSAGRRLDFTTDALGRILTISGPDPEQADARLTLVQYAYEESGNLIRAIDALGYAWQFQYAGHLLVQEANRVGLNFYFEYDGTDHTARCRRTWGDGGIYDTKLTYPTADLTVVTDSLGATTQYAHAQGLATLITDALGGVTQRVYNAHGELELERNALDQATLYDYDQRGQLIRTTQPTGVQTQLSYNAQDLLTQALDANGGIWQWQYDEVGNLTQRQDPLGATTTYEYEHGLVVSILDALGQRTRLAYDAQHNVRHVVTADQHIRSRHYDALGRLVSLIDAGGAMQRRRYDYLGQLTGVLEADGTVRQLGYDGEGNVVYSSNGQHEVTCEYAGQGSLVRQRKAGTEVRFYYDLEGRLTGLDNELQETYRFELDLLGQVIEERGFDGLTRRYQRDAGGRVLQVERPGGRSTHYSYDALGSLATVAHNDEAPTAYTYGADGTLLAARTGGASVQFERDPLGRVVREIQNGVSVDSAYNALGQRTALHSSLGAALTLTRDVVGGIAEMRAGNWFRRSERDAQGLEMHRVLSGGVSTSWQRDALGRPTSQRISVGPGAVTVRQRRYHWQGADQLTAIEDSLAGETRYTYDALGYLTAAHYPDGTQELRQADAVGNLFRTSARTDRRYAASGQLREANGTRYKYDAEGNLIRKTLPTGEIWQYEWDGAGQLTHVKRPDGYAVTFTYDALGRRVSKRFRGKVTNWVWDGDKPLHEWQAVEVGPDANSVSEVLTWLFEEESFAPVAKLTAQDSYSVVSDHLGTPLALYNEKGMLAWTMALDTYGAVRQGKGRAQDCPFRYQGQYEDTETGLYYNRFRYYDPEVGHYISQDPIRLQSGSPLYSYVKNPLAWLDLFGLSCSSDAALLRENMVAAGEIEPAYGNAAHHMVMSNSNDARMVQLRAQLTKHNIDINDADNGIFLARSSAIKKSNNLSSIAHSRIHTNVYKEAIFNRINPLTSEAEIRNALGGIRSEIGAGTFPF
jgi:RHS repeat-associated protein